MSNSKIKKIIISCIENWLCVIVFSILPLPSYCYIQSIIQNVSFYKIIMNIPFYFYIILPCIVLCIKYIRYKMNEGKNTSLIGIIGGNDGYKPLCLFLYKDMFWEIKANKSYLCPDPTDILVEDNPRCPECKTELRCQDKFLYYKWYCINEPCSFIKRTWHAQDKMQSDVKKVVKRKIEKTHNSYYK